MIDGAAEQQVLPTSSHCAIAAAL